jgi:hypothetical protein
MSGGWLRTLERTLTGLERAEKKGERERGDEREFELQGHGMMRGTVWDEYVGLEDWYKCINL